MHALPGFAPLGRLYDPLIQLTERIHRALAGGCTTVWTDDRGSVFVNDAFLLRSMSPLSVVGTYDRRTPPWVIERDLRLALRRRASQWIVDWDVPIPEEVNARRQRPVVKSASRPRRRRRLAIDA
jgi:hypothetical protein